MKNLQRNLLRLAARRFHVPKFLAKENTTKGGLIAYYAKIWPYILPYLKAARSCSTASLIARTGPFLGLL
jgi:hypothetical protein